jgi:soluble P-type ATPase
MILEEIIKNENIYDIEDWYIRFVVAKNNNTSTATLEQLSRDVNCVVRRAVTHNHNTSKNILIYLLKDKNDEVRKNAFDRIGRMT